MAEATREQILAELRKRQAATPTREQIMSELATRNQPSAIRQAGNLGMEFISGLNRPVAGMIDAVLPGNPLSSRIGRAGDFAGPGLMTDMASTAGEFAGMALPAGVASRTAFRAYDALLSSMPAARKAGAVESIFRNFASTGATDDLLGGAASGAGSVAGGEMLANLYGENGRQTGEMIGGLASPMALGVAVNIARPFLSASQRLLNQATPDIEMLRGARRAQYALLEQVGVKGTVKARQDIISRIDEFASDQAIDYKKGTTGLATQMRKLRAASQNDELTYQLLFDVSGELNTLAKRNKGTTLATQASSLRGILDEFATGMDITPESRRILGDRTIAEVKRNADELYNREKTHEAISIALDRATRQSEGNFTNRDFYAAFESELKKLSDPQKKTGQSLYLTDSQRSKIREVIQGGSIQKTLNAIQAVGFQSGDFLRTAILGGLGTAIVGSGQDVAVAGGAGLAAGAVAATAVSRAARYLSGQLLQKNASMAQNVVRAGDDANKIVRAYMKHTKSSDRNALDLGRLLMSTNADLDGFSNSPLVKRSTLLSDAVFVANAGNRLAYEEWYASQGDVPQVPSSLP